MTTDAVHTAAKAREAGFAYPCSMCKKLWRQMDKGSMECEAIVYPDTMIRRPRATCEGPFEGDSFPGYEGILSDVALAENCFVCGAPGHIVMDTPRGSRKLGVCRTHVAWFQREMRRRSEAKQQVVRP